MAERILIRFAFGSYIIESVPEPVKWVHSSYFTCSTSYFQETKWPGREMAKQKRHGFIGGYIDRMQCESFPHFHETLDLLFSRRASLSSQVCRS